TGDIDHAQIPLFDDSIEMDVDEVQSGRRPPMAEQPWLDMLALERLFEQRIIIEINLANRQIVRRSPIGIHPLEQAPTESFHPSLFHILKSFRRDLKQAKP